MRFFYRLPDFVRVLYRQAFWRGGLSSRCVYLTFDDGPVAGVTEKVLDILDRYGVRATFFWVGENVRRDADLACEVLRRGHSVGNHTMRHVRGWGMGREEYAAEVSGAQAAIDEVAAQVGAEQKVKLFRPPYGKAGWRKHKWLQEQGYKVVLWDVISHVYNSRLSAETIERAVLRYVRNGSVVLFHDSLKAKERVLAVLPRVIEELQRRGMEFGVVES